MKALRGVDYTKYVQSIYYKFQLIVRITKGNNSNNTNPSVPITCELSLRCGVNLNKIGQKLLKV